MSDDCTRITVVDDTHGHPGEDKRESGAPELRTPETELIDAVVMVLRDNPEEVKKSACDILTKLLTNIINDPNNTK